MRHPRTTPSLRNLIARPPTRIRTKVTTPHALTVGTCSASVSSPSGGRQMFGQRRQLGRRGTIPPSAVQQSRAAWTHVRSHPSYRQHITMSPHPASSAHAFPQALLRRLDQRIRCALTSGPARPCGRTGADLPTYLDSMLVQADGTPRAAAEPPEPRTGANQVQASARPAAA